MNGQPAKPNSAAEAGSGTRTGRSRRRRERREVIAVLWVPWVPVSPNRVRGVKHKIRIHKEANEAWNTALRGVLLSSPAAADCWTKATTTAQH